MLNHGDSSSESKALKHTRKLSQRSPASTRSGRPKLPVLILGAANAVNARGAANAYAMYDLGAAAVSITLAAEALGLVTHQMGGYDHDAARKEFGIPESYALGSVMALGYQDAAGRSRQ